jgi:squalene-associated FAD-dependent desaturase
MCAADTRSVAVVGGGWAGCSAAVELARKKCRVTLFESSRTLGGRARRIELNGMSLDNGQHIMLGAYRETLRMLRIVGIDACGAFLSLPLQIRYPEGTGGMNFIAPRLPAPLHVLVALLRASGLDRDDKMSLAHFSTTARWMQWKLDNDCSVAELLDRFDQTDRLIQLMWRPLCIAALNTPPERASAQVFLNVLRDSLGARRAASDMLVPKADLSALFPDHAATFVKSNGGEIHLGAIVRAVKQDDSGWTLEVDNASSGLSTQRFDAVIIATQATHAATLLGPIHGTPRVPDFDYEPITTCYLQYDPSIRLTQPFFALLDEPESGRWGQFVFDRGQLDNRYAGLLAVVVSASTEAIELGHEHLCAAIARQLGDAFKAPAFKKPMWSRAVSEKRATFACTPALSRPANETGVDGLLLAGDYTDSDYPATLEAAVRSGIRAAHLAA